MTSAFSPRFRPAESGDLDLLMMAFFAVLLFSLVVTHKNRIVRLEGLLLLLIYSGYTAFRASGGDF